MSQQPNSQIHVVPQQGTILEYGSKIRLFVHSKQEATHGHCGYVAGYFLDTQLPPSLIIQQSLTSSNQNILHPYIDLTQSIYFRIIDPADMNCQFKKQVRFGDTFHLIPYNSTTGEEIVQSFDHIAPHSKMREKLFTFTQSSLQQGNQTPTFTSRSLPTPTNTTTTLPQQPQLDDKFVRYGFSNVTLNIIKTPLKDKKSIGSPVPIEFVKDKHSTYTGGYLTSSPETITSTRGEPIQMKPIVFAIRAADEPILTVQVYDSTTKPTTSTTNDKTTIMNDNRSSMNNNNNNNNNSITLQSGPPPLSLSNHPTKDTSSSSTTSTTTVPGTLLRTIPIQQFHQHHTIHTGDDITNKTLVIHLRDIGHVILPLASFAIPPLNFFYSKFAPPTTSQEYYDHQDLQPTQPESIIRPIHIHGSQLSVTLPVRYTRIEAQPPKEPFIKGQKNNSFEKLPLPLPNTMICFLAFFILAYRLFIGLQNNLFSYEYIDIIRYIGPFLIIAFISISYPSFTGNKGHSLKFRSEQPHCHYIMQFLQPRDETTNKEVTLAFPVPSPSTLSNPLFPIGSTIPLPIDPFPTIMNTNYNINKDGQTPQQQLETNIEYQYQIKLQTKRAQLDENSLELFQILDTIRSASLFTDANLTANCYTLPQTSIALLDDKLNKEMVKPPADVSGTECNLRTLIKSLHTSGPNPSIIAQLLQYNKDISYTLNSPHYSKGHKIDIKLYYPFIFKAIRESHAVSTEDFIEAWTFGVNNLPQSAVGAGRSGALFMRSSCQRFIFKTMNKADMATLRAVVDDYGAYITTNPSMLMRILGVFRIIRDGKKMYFLIANNAFYLPDYISQHYKLVSKYDLKGRTPKRDPNQRLDEANDGVWKDLQLSRVFCLHHVLRDQIVSNVDSDVKWLQQHDCIDYSLLVGVAENEQLALLCTSDDTDTVPNDLQKLLEQCSVPHIAPNLESHRSVCIPPYVKAEDDTSEVFFVAIVDFLARFDNMMKKGAHAFKSIRWKDDELSTVNSQFYGDRFNAYTKVVFPPTGAVLVRNRDDLERYFKQEAADIIIQQQTQATSGNPNQILSSPIKNSQQHMDISDQQTSAIADLSLKQLPESALRALEPSARSPGSLIVTRTGKHVVIVPNGVHNAPRSLVERSKVAAELSKLTSRTAQAPMD